MRAPERTIPDPRAMLFYPDHVEQRVQPVRYRHGENISPLAVADKDLLHLENRATALLDLNGGWRSPLHPEMSCRETRTLTIASAVNGFKMTSEMPEGRLGEQR